MRIFWVPRPGLWVWLDNKPHVNAWLSFESRKNWFIRLRFGLFEWGLHFLLWEYERRKE